MSAAYLSDNLAALVQHASENLCGHDQARGIGVDGDVTSHQADILKLLI